VPLHDEHETWKDAKGNEIQGGRFVIKEMRLGDAVFHDVEGHVAIFDDSFPAPPLGNVGHVGEALVRPYKGAARLSWRDHDSALCRRSKCGEGGVPGCNRPLRSEWEGSPVSTAKTSLGTLTFIWDTRCERFGHPSRHRGNPWRRAARHGDSHRRLRARRRRLRPARAARVRFQEPAGVDGFVGANFFADHVVCVDFPNKRFLVR
jgi:hypothetical protein